MKNRLIGLCIGLVYALVYGLFTMFITGGGHGNFLWLLLFVFSYFFGLFFPISGFLIVDLQPIWAKAVLGMLLVLHIVALWWYFGSLVTGILENDQQGLLIGDVLKSREKSPGSFIFFASIHLTPLIVVVSMLFNSFVRSDKKNVDTIIGSKNIPSNNNIL